VCDVAWKGAKCANAIEPVELAMSSDSSDGTHRMRRRILHLSRAFAAAQPPRHWLRPNENCTLYAGAVPTHRPEDDVPLAALKGKPAAKKPAAKKKKKTAGPKKKIKKKDSKNSKVPHPRPLVRCAGYALLLTGWLAGWLL